MSNEKMTQEERKIAALAVTNALKAVHTINLLHGQCDKLMTKYEWDCDTWEISRAAMLVANEGLGIAYSIGREDGWAQEVML